MNPKSIGRRLFARAAVGVPMALKGGAVNATSPMGVHPPPTPAFGMGMQTAGEMAKQSFISKIWDSIRVGTRDQQEYGQLRWARRQMMGGLDPDLAVLNSMSLQRRVQIQIDREKEMQERERSIRHRIIRSMGGKPEDFE